MGPRNHEIEPVWENHLHCVGGPLASHVCQEFLRQQRERGNITEDKKALAAGDNFIRKITEAVAPVLPITLRTKALDGGYFRTALQLIAAAEIIFLNMSLTSEVELTRLGLWDVQQHAC